MDDMFYRRMAYRRAVRANFAASQACKEDEQQIKTTEKPNCQSSDDNNDACKTQQDNQEDN